MSLWRWVQCKIRGGHRFTSYGFDDCEECMWCGKRYLGALRFWWRERRGTC